MYTHITELVKLKEINQIKFNFYIYTTLIFYSDYIFSRCMTLDLIVTNSDNRKALKIINEFYIGKYE